MSKEIGEEIMDTYFKLKKERAKKRKIPKTSTDLKVENGKDVQKDQAEIGKVRKMNKRLKHVFG